MRQRAGFAYLEKEEDQNGICMPAGRPSSSVSLPISSALRAASLVPAIRGVLEEAIAAGGSSLRDFRRSDGALGYFQHAFRVYGRADEACPTPGCEGRIRRLVQAGRSSFYCPACQR